MATKRRSHGQGTLFKRSGRGPWIASWHDHTGKRLERSTRTTDKAAAERILAKRVADAALRREGVIDPKDDQYKLAETRPLSDHIDEFQKALLAKGNTEDHAKEATAHVRRVASLCKAERISDLTSSAVQSAIASVRDSGRSLRTCNSILRSVKTFIGWLYRDRRCRENTLIHLNGYNADTDRRRVRRDFTPTELRFLIRVAETGPSVMGMSGQDRAMAYRLAAGTGFRVSELSSLIPESFDLESSPPAVTVTAAYSKRRRDDVQPIRLDLAELLRPWLADKRRRKPVLPLPDKTAKMIRTDLNAAGISCRDEMGRVLDFHSLRHSYITNVVNSGASVKVAQELARHSTPTLTIGRYAHARLHDLSAALDRMPDINATHSEVAKHRATGTDDAAADPQQYPQQLGRESTQRHTTPCEDRTESRSSDGLPKCLLITDKCDERRRDAMRYENESDGNRTRNLRIDSPVL